MTWGGVGAVGRREGELGRSEQRVAQQRVVPGAIAVLDAISFVLSTRVNSAFLCFCSFGDSEAAGWPHRAPDGAIRPAKRGGESPLPLSALFPLIPLCQSPLVSPAFPLWV